MTIFQMQVVKLLQYDIYKEVGFTAKLISNKLSTSHSQAARACNTLVRKGVLKKYLSHSKKTFYVLA